MADATTRLADGFVAAAVLRACRVRGVFQALAASAQPLSPADLAQRCGGLRLGYLAVMLRTLRGLGWLQRDLAGCDALTARGRAGWQAEAAGAAPDVAALLQLDLLALFGLPVAAWRLDSDATARQAAVFASWVQQLQSGWPGLEPSVHASLYTGCLCAYVIVSLQQAGRLKGLAGGNIDIEGHRGGDDDDRSSHQPVPTAATAADASAQPSVATTAHTTAQRTFTLALEAVHPRMRQPLYDLFLALGWAEQKSDATRLEGVWAFLLLPLLVPSASFFPRLFVAPHPPPLPLQRPCCCFSFLS